MLAKLLVYEKEKNIIGVESVMKILFLNGNSDPGNSGFESYLETLSAELQKRGHQVEILPLRNMQFGRCVGCFGCWVKTPGRCVQKDESDLICRRIVNSDFLLFASPLAMGFTTGLLRRASEKMIPILLPYFVVSKGEVRHKKRYPKYPVLGLLVEKEDDTDGEDMEIISNIYDQIASEMHSSLKLAKTISDPVKEVADAFDGI